MAATTSFSNRVLIVDDNPENLKVLSQTLTLEGHQVNIATSGKQALNSVSLSAPALILLDVKMPEMDGYETCSILKSDPLTQDIPVIFISALSETADKVKAFEMGGVDYITKPFQAQEVIARVNTHLSLRHMQNHLEELVDNRSAQLKKANEHFNLTINAADIATWDWDLINNAITWSTNAEQTFALAPNAFGNSIDKFLNCLHPEDVAPFNQKVMQSIDRKDTKYDTEYRLISSSGQVCHIKAPGQIFYSQEGTPLRIAGVMIDVSEQKRTEKALLESEEKFRTLVTHFEEIVYMVSKDGTFTLSEGRGLETLGLKPQQVVGSSIYEVFNDFTEVTQAMESTFLGETIVQEVLLGEHFFRNWFTPHRNQNNEIIGLLGLSVNITNIKKAEDSIRRKNSEIATQNEEYETLNEELQKTNEQLLDAKRNAEESDRLKTEFINNMSHEIRTPMNGILGFSNFLEDQELTLEKRQFYINIIQNSGNQLLRVIDDILEISQLGTKQVKVIEEKINLNNLLYELFSVFDIKAKENKTPLYLKKGLTDTNSVIYTDATKLNKILSNLLENSLKFTNVGYIEFGYRLVSSFGEKTALEIFVRDTGIGIKQEMQKIIFDRFSQEEKELSQKSGGLGLGLSIAKENTELLGGTISLKSEKGEGASFFVTIPYKPANPNSQAKNNESQYENTSKKNTILIVEDEEINFLYLETLLESIPDCQYHLLHAKNGMEAIQYCEKHQNISLVLMDLKMPIMNGFDATRKIREFRPKLPIIAQTAYSSLADKEKALAVGCNDFISKPIVNSAFIDIINRYYIQ